MKQALLLLMALCLTPSGTAAAAVVAFDFDNVFSGAGLSGPTPWVTANFSDTTGGVALRVRTNGLSGTESLKSVYFNLDPLLNVTQLTFQHVGGQTASVTTGTDEFKADGDGKYDILIEFGTGASGFAAGGSSDWLISGIGSLGAWSFDALSQPSGGNGPFRAAAHIQGIAGYADDSAWASATVSEVPLPPAAGLLGAGLILLGSRLRRRKAGWKRTVVSTHLGMRSH